MLFTCGNTKCKREYTDKESPKIKWLDDDYDDLLGTKWLVFATCPYCGSENDYEIWIEE